MKQSTKKFGIHKLKIGISFWKKRCESGDWRGVKEKCGRNWTKDLQFWKGSFVKIVKNYYDRFKVLNPQYSEIKLGIIAVIIIYFIARIFFVVEISRDMIISLLVFVISMTLHEVAHGYVAYKFGDDTAKREGRITLNPLKHIDLTGIILPVLILLSGFKFLVGWAKPVPVNFYNLRPHRLGLFCVAVAGIVVNFILAGISLVFLKLGSKYLDIDNIFMTVMIYVYVINLLLGLFNLIPITPLDGGRIVYSFSGNKIREFYNKIERYGILIIFVIVYFSGSRLTQGFLVIVDFFLKLAGIDINLTF